MPRIQDIGAFNAVRESGLAKLAPARPEPTAICPLGTPGGTFDSTAATFSRPEMSELCISLSTT